MYMSCYYDRNRGKYCNDCKLNKHGKGSCFDAMMADIINRVNRLAGDVLNRAQVNRRREDCQS